MEIDAATRAKNTYKLIERKPSTLIFTKPQVVAANGTVTPETALAAQIVRCNADNRSTVIGGEAGLNPQRTMMVYGVTAHPTAPANDIAEGYVFKLDGESWRVVYVTPGTPGVIQAQASLT